MTDAFGKVARSPGRPRKNQQERAAMKSHIAETARVLFQNGGYAKVSMRRLAKEAGCSPMTIYDYYDGKIGVLQTLWTLVFEDLFEQLNTKLGGISDPAERLLEFCKEYTGFWIRNPEHYRLVFMADGVTQPEVSLFLDQPEVTAGLGLLSELVAAARLASRQSTSVKMDTDMLVSTMHGIAHNQITISGYLWTDYEQLVMNLVSMISKE